MLEVKDTTDTQMYAAYLDLQIENVNGERLKKLYDKRDDFTFPIVNFPFTSGNIPASPRMQLIFYDSYVILGTVPSSDFLDRAQLLTQSLLKQVYVAARLKSLLQINRRSSSRSG